MLDNSECDRHHLRLGPLAPPSSAHFSAPNASSEASILSRQYGTLVEEREPAARGEPGAQSARAPGQSSPCAPQSQRWRSTGCRSPYTAEPRLGGESLRCL